MVSEYLPIAYYRRFGIKINGIWLLIILLVVLAGELLTGINSGLPSIVASGIIFVFVIKLPSFYSSTINWLASSVFASYLVTEDIVLRKLFWYFACHQFRMSNNFLEGLIITVLTLLITILIDKVYLLLRNGLLRKPIDLLMLKIYGKLNQYLHS